MANPAVSQAIEQLALGSVQAYDFGKIIERNRITDIIEKRFTNPLETKIREELLSEINKDGSHLG